MTVKRILIMTGDKKWIEQTLEKSLVQPGKNFEMPNGEIIEVDRIVLEGE